MTKAEYIEKEILGFEEREKQSFGIIPEKILERIKILNKSKIEKLKNLTDEEYDEIVSYDLKTEHLRQHFEINKN